MAGRKIELHEEDSEGNPSKALAKYRKLVTSDKIHVLSGILLSNFGYSLVPLIEADHPPTLFLTTPDELTKRKPGKWLLRSNFSASQPMHPLGDYAAKTLKYRRVAAVAMDNPFGHDPDLVRRLGLFDYLRARLAVAGTPEDCIEQVRAAEQAGVRRLMFSVSLAADPVRTVELFGTRVLPLLAGG